MILALVVVARSLNNVTGARLNCAVQFGEIGLHCSKHEIMKLYLFTFGLLFCNVLFSSGQTLYPSGVPGCIARWTFDGENVTALVDSSGNGQHGVSFNTSFTKGYKNYHNTAYRFDGISSYAQVASSSILEPQSITVVALLKFHDFYSGPCQGNNIIYKGFNYNSLLSWSMYTTDGNYDNDCSAVNPTKQKLNFVTPNYVNTGIPLNDFIDTTYWYLLMASYNGNTINYYQIKMDPTNLLTTIPASYSIPCLNPIGMSGDDVFIGATQNPPFKYWLNASVDEIILFNHALSNTEVLSVYNYLHGMPTTVQGFEPLHEDWVVHKNQTLLFQLPLLQEDFIDIVDLGSGVQLFRGQPESQMNTSNWKNRICVVRWFQRTGGYRVKRIQF